MKEGHISLEPTSTLHLPSTTQPSLPWPGPGAPGALPEERGVGIILGHCSSPPSLLSYVDRPRDDLACEQMAETGM